MAELEDDWLVDAEALPTTWDEDEWEW